MEAIFEILFELLFETVLVLLWEGLVRLWQGVFSSSASGVSALASSKASNVEDSEPGTLSDALSEAVKKPAPHWLTQVALYAALGAVIGAVSAFVMPQTPLKPGFVPAFWQHANLLLSPVLAGACMAAYGAWRAKRGLDVLPLDRFACGWAFAQALVAVRFWLGP